MFFTLLRATVAFLGFFILCQIVSERCINFGSFIKADLVESEHAEMSSLRAVFVTVPTIEVGKSIAHGLVSKKLAACVNIVPQVLSVYEWEGKVQEDSELLLMIKTQTQHFEELAKFVKETHPYDVPEVIAVPIEQGSQAYLDWLVKSTTKDKSSVDVTNK